MSWLPIPIITDLDVDNLIPMSTRSLCEAFCVPLYLIGVDFSNGESKTAIVAFRQRHQEQITEDAEFEIIEPKQLPDANRLQ